MAFYFEPTVQAVEPQHLRESLFHYLKLLSIVNLLLLFTSLNQSRSILALGLPSFVLPSSFNFGNRKKISSYYASVGISGLKENIRFDSYESEVYVGMLREPEKLLNLHCLESLYWYPTTLIAQFGSAGSLTTRVTERTLELL